MLTSAETVWFIKDGGREGGWGVGGGMRAQVHIAFHAAQSSDQSLDIHHLFSTVRLFTDHVGSLGAV